MSARRRPNTSSWWWTCLVSALATALVAACVVVLVLYQTFGKKIPAPERGPESMQSDAIILEIAYTPEKETLFRELVRRFNASQYRTLKGKPITVQATSLDAEAMVEAVLSGSFDAVSPDSSIWLEQFDIRWREQEKLESSIVGETFRYAVSPIVIAMWEDVAREMGYPEKAIGWEDILQRAASDSGFRWSHPSTSSASGLLATLATFYAGVNKTRGLTREDALAEKTLAYVSAVERTVRYYGEGELAVISRALTEGPGFLDAFVVQEQLVIYFNRQSQGPRLVAIYPVEGTLWKDHPLALIERPSLGSEDALTADERQAFSAFRGFLVSPEAQRFVLEQGYRPTDLSIPLDDPSSPITAQYGVDASQPQTTLQIPGASVLDVVRQAWWYTKRHTNVYLVADISGSMEGDKLREAQVAMQTFVDQIQGDMERVGLITFASQVEEIVPLGELSTNRSQLEASISALRAGGNTALLDGVWQAYTRLQGLKDRERINAIVVMTDGRENRSRIRLAELTRRIETGNRTELPVVIFCIAYGADADMKTLEAIAQASGGQARYGDPATIKDLYKVLSTYF